MKVVLSYCHRDYNLAFFAAATMLNHTDMKPENLVLYGSRFAPQPPKGFKDIAFIQAKDDPATYPMGPNVMAASLFDAMAKGMLGERVFMVEPDGFPTCIDWYDKVLKAHLDTNAWVSGSMVDWVKPKHYNGNLVMESRFAEENPCLTRAVVDAWDCHHAELILRAGAPNPEVHNAKRVLSHYPTNWWKQYKSAWVHGCQNFQMWEEIDRGWLNEQS